MGEKTLEELTLEDLCYERHDYGKNSEVVEYVNCSSTIQFYKEQNMYHTFTSCNGKEYPMRMDIRTTQAILNTMKALGLDE